MQIRIDHYGDEARDARRRVMALASALEGDRDAYMAGLEKEIERVLGQTDPAALTQLIADLADASAVVAFTLGSSLAEEWKVDLDGLFRGVERVLEERKPSNGAAPPSEDA